MYLSYRLVKMTSYHTFRAPDPWDHGQVSDWSLSQYGIAAAMGVDPNLAEALQNPSPDRIKAQSLGIESQPDGRYHILPRSLGELSYDREVADEELPALLHQIEPALEDLDFKHPTDMLFAFYAYFCGLVLIGFCVLLFADLKDAKLVLGCITFFGFFTTVTFGRMARCRLRKQRQKTELAKLC